MLTMKRIGSATAVALLAILGAAPSALALTNSDRPTSAVIFTDVAVSTDTSQDTLLRLSNASDSASVTAKCFYINSNSHCSNTGGVCTSFVDCVAGSTIGVCLPGWTVTDFQVVLTRRQPLGWLASRGLASTALPMRGVRVCSASSANAGASCTSFFDCPGGTCIDGQDNDGTLIPPVPELSFVGELRCIEVDPATDTPFAGASNTNDLEGQASITTILPDGTIDVATYNAVGFASNFNSDTNNELVLGDEYGGCASVLVVNHLFDGATNPIDAGSSSATILNLSPCSGDLSGADPSLGVSTAQFLVYNEFEQRFSTSRRVDCHFQSLLSLIDTTQSPRSIWNAAVAGTVAGQTRIRPVGSGLVGSARLAILSAAGGGSSAYNIHQDGDRTVTDSIIIP
ncbi:MAG: hypothetical protein HY699_06720 [Deltaproteobacteria bacterium]|nr:hypothetical protein [Deltaproteobacteria bacterium]